MDDEEPIRETLSAVLWKLGHTAEAAESAEAAFEVFDSGRFDVVITDLHLPGMRGDQFARIVKRENGEMPVILLTAFPPAQTPEGIDHIIVKPCSIDTLKEAFAAVRGRSRGANRR